MALLVINPLCRFNSLSFYSPLHEGSDIPSGKYTVSDYEALEKEDAIRARDFK